MSAAESEAARAAGKTLCAWSLPSDLVDALDHQAEQEGVEPSTIAERFFASYLAPFIAESIQGIFDRSGQTPGEFVR